MIEPRSDMNESASQKLARSRAQLQHLFEPEQHASNGASPGTKRHGAFPRSATMKLLTKGGGAKALSFIAVALLATRPATAARLLRYLPLSAITKILVARFVSAQGAKK